MSTVIMVLLCLLFAAFAVIAFMTAHKEKEERKKVEEALERARLANKKIMEAYADADEKKKAADTGDINHDLDVMANELRN